MTRAAVNSTHQRKGRRTLVAIAPQGAIETPATGNGNQLQVAGVERAVAVGAADIDGEIEGGCRDRSLGAVDDAADDDAVALFQALGISEPLGIVRDRD